MRKINLNILLAVCVLMMTLTGPAGAVTHYVSPGGEYPGGHRRRKRLR